MGFVRGAAFGLAVVAWAGSALAAPFRFEAETSLDDMRGVIRGAVSTASTRDEVRAIFVGQGGATLVAHPRRAGVEKYLYDINLCSYYVWRWNISADYRPDGRLEQIYLNGSPLLNGAAEAALPTKGPFYQLARPRPQAFKGEKSLAAIVTDADGDTKTTDDMMLMTGVGPTRADPADMGRAVNNRGEVWRSIFDADDAKSVAPYPGDCAAVDAVMAKQLGAAAPAATRGAPAGGMAQTPPRPASLDDNGVRPWLAAYIKADGWTLITADKAAVVFGSPGGVARQADNTLTADIRHEYYAPTEIGGMQTRSNLQGWTVDCAGRRIRIRSMTIYEGANLTGASQGRTFDDSPWTAVEPNSTRARTIDRICAAPATGPALK